jgi:Esterase/lipase
MSKLDRLLRTKSSTRLVPEAAPYRSSPVSAKDAVLLCHGFTGFPGELSAVGEALAGIGIASYAPRYPGHGTDRSDFFASGAEDWFRRALDSYLELAAEYETVHVLGHSMGGLIATLIAERFGAPKLVLLAPAFKVNSPLALTPFLSLFTPAMRRPRANEETDPVRKILFPEYWKDDLVSGAAQLLKLQRAASRTLPRLRSETLVITGDADETVPPSIVGLIEKRATEAASLSFKTIEGGGHDFPCGYGSERACEEIVAWLRD